MPDRHFDKKILCINDRPACIRCCFCCNRCCRNHQSLASNCRGGW